jgi:riboflavin synthase
MFTGIIQAVGHLLRSENRGGDRRISFSAGTLDLSDVNLGDSIAVSGVCLTAVMLDAGGFAVDVSNETLARTTLGGLKSGQKVNLEKALRLADRLGGHLVSGHVDGLAKVLSISTDGRSQRWMFSLPNELARYVAAKGSICVDGVSLTVNEVADGRFGVNLIPHTIGQTTFAERAIGDAVNLEIDLIARYVERLSGAGQSPLSEAFLRDRGFS